jgi:hypothetical protein
MHLVIIIHTDGFRAYVHYDYNISTTKASVNYLPQTIIPLNLQLIISSAGWIKKNGTGFPGPFLAAINFYLRATTPTHLTHSIPELS